MSTSHHRHGLQLAQHAHRMRSAPSPLSPGPSQARATGGTTLLPSRSCVPVGWQRRQGYPEDFVRFLDWTSNIDSSLCHRKGSSE